MRRALMWLAVASFAFCTAVVFVAAAVIDGRFELSGTVGVVLLVGVPILVLLLTERRASSARRPARWAPRGLGVTMPTAVAVGIVTGASPHPASGPAWGELVLAGAAVMIAVGVPLVLAGRALRYPLSADLGGVDVDVSDPLRGTAPWLPSWLARDEVRLTGDSLVITVRPDSKWAFVERVPLEDIGAVTTRPAAVDDGPWFVVDDGPMLWAPPGEVVVVTHRGGTKLLPVYHPAGFAEVLLARVRHLAAMAEGDG